MAIARRNLPWTPPGRPSPPWTVTGAIGAGLGYPVTGLIAQLLNFRAAYWFGAITVTGALGIRPALLTADVSGFLISIAMYLLLPIIVEFVQIPPSAGYGFAASLVVSGLILTPLSVGSFVASRFLIVYERRFGSRTMIPLGSVVFAAGAAFFALEHSALWQAFVTVAVCGLGVGFTTGAMPGFIIRAVPQSETGSATGFYQVVRSIGLTVGSPECRRADGPHPARSGPAGCGRSSGPESLPALCLVTGVVSYRAARTRAVAPH